MKPLRYILEYILFTLARMAVRFLSAATVYSLGRTLGQALYRVSAKRRGIARLNLDHAFGNEKTPAEKTRIVKESMIQQCVSLFQFLWVSSNPETRASQLIEGEPEGLDVVAECLGRGRGILFLTAHYGNWEIMGVNHGYHCPGNLVSIARRLDNPHLERFVLRLRTVSGNRILYRDESPIKLVRALKNNECLAVMMDQNAGDWGTFVDFFGKAASTARALPLLSYNHGTPILPSSGASTWSSMSASYGTLDPASIPVMTSYSSLYGTRIGTPRDRVSPAGMISCTSTAPERN